MLQKSAIMLLSKIIFRDWLTAILPYDTDRNDQPPLAETVCSPAQHWSCSKSRRHLLSSLQCLLPSLETVVNVVPEAKLSDRLLVLQPARGVTSSGNCACAIRMGLKITELCQHNAR